MLSSISSRNKVYKQRTLMCSICFPDQQYVTENPWVAIHPAGNRYFGTWREAMDYASSPIYMYNAA